MTTHQIKVLIIEDNLDDVELLVLELESANYQVVYEQVETAQSLITALKYQQWDVILADYSMPKFSAIAALELVKCQEIDTPFIVVSGSIGEEIAVQLMKAGAHDYLLKQNLTRLAPAIERELREAKMRSERRLALETVEYLAFRDELTGLPNRNAFLNILQEKINNAQQDDFIFAVVFLDIDQYRTIKYGFGHLKSEQLLVEIAKRLENQLRPGDCLARVGKDEFAFMLGNLSNVSAAEALANQVHQVIDPPLDLQGFVIYASVTIGVVDSTIGFVEPEDFLRAAEIANYTAKKNGIQSYSTVIYTQKMQKEALERLHMETELRLAICNQNLQLFYQPIVSLESWKLVGFEALIRWQHPHRGWISPSQFIPLAEQTGLIIPLGEWILEAACRQLNIWQKELPDYLPLTVSVNLSGVQLNEPEIVPKIIEIHRSLDFQQVKLKLEITESKLMNNRKKVIPKLEELRAAGIQISIDDFGTGYSSLSYLQDLPIDTLKVDRSFVAGIGKDERNLGIMQTIITLAQTLDLDVIAEGLETINQMDSLRFLGCNYGQGYLFAPPMPAHQVPKWLARNKNVNHFKLRSLNQSI
jgi:diguanylate cyclase (GGDEF)-like protein